MSPKPGVLPVRLAAVQMARIYDFADHDPYEPLPAITPERTQQWATRIRVWTKRYADRLHPTRGANGRLLYDLEELLALADSLRPRRLTKIHRSM